MDWKRAGRVALLVGAMGITLVGGGAVLAQSTGDAALQWRVLRRSDGASFVYRDGLRYPIVPAALSDVQIDAIPEAGLLVERLDSLFTLAGAPSPGGATPMPAAVAPAAAVVPSTSVSPLVTASFDAAVAGLVGQTLRTCGLLGVPVNVVVQQADPVQGPDGVRHILLIASVTNVGNRVTQSSLPIELLDNRNRLYPVTSAGLNPDITILARQYGINELTQQELGPGLSQRQLWTFEVPPDIQTLTLSPDPLARCDGTVVP